MNTQLRKLVLVFALVILSSESRAVFILAPVGHQEAFMANTGVAMDDSPAAGLYNPAGLGFSTSKDLKLSLSGNAIEQQNFSSGMQDDTSGFSIRPMMASGIYPFFEGHASVFVANPTSAWIEQNGNLSSGGVPYSLRLNMHTDTLLLGLSYGQKITPNLSWGLSVGGNYQTQKVYTYLAYSNSTFAGTSYQQSLAKSLSAMLIPGVTWQPTDYWNLGLSVVWLPFKIASEGKFYSASTLSSAPTTVTESSSTFDPYGQRGPMVTFGQEFKFGIQSVFVDLTYQGQSDSVGSDGTVSKGSDGASYSIGWRGGYSSIQPLAGFSYGHGSDEDDYLISAGINWKRKNSDFLVGVYYQDHVPLDASGWKLSSYGVMFSTNVAY
jgi:hypothetical protein